MFFILLWCTWRRVKKQKYKKDFLGIVWFTYSFASIESCNFGAYNFLEAMFHVSSLHWDRFIYFFCHHCYHPALKLYWASAGKEALVAYWVVCPRWCHSPNRSPQQRITLGGGRACLFHTIITGPCLGFYCGVKEARDMTLSHTLRLTRVNHLAR